METLVLDQSWLPVAKVSWQRALTLYFQSKVQIVSSYEDREIKSVTFAIKMPSVVRFLKAVRGRKRLVKFSRENVYGRDRGRCQYCNNKVERHEATYDHVLPRARGGKTDWTNIVIACVPCNQKKGGRTPEQASMKLLSIPVKPKKLPEMRITIVWRKGMPTDWAQWLTDAVYWNGELEE